MRHGLRWWIVSLSRKVVLIVVIIVVDRELDTCRIWGDPQVTSFDRLISARFMCNGKFYDATEADVQQQQMCSGNGGLWVRVPMQTLVPLNARDFAMDFTILSST